MDWSTDEHDSRDRRQALRVLRQAGPHGLTIDELRARGVPQPGQTIYELRVDGYEIERVPRVHGDGARTVAYRHLDFASPLAAHGPDGPPPADT